MRKKIIFIIFISVTSFNFLNAQITNWVHTWGGNKVDDATSIAIDKNGNNIVAGYTESYGPGTINVLLQKFDKEGNLLWSVTWGDSLENIANSVAVDNNNNIYVTGYTTSVNSEWYDILILKFNPDGDLIWSKVWGKSDYDAGYGICIDRQGNILISGESYSFGSSAVLLKYDVNGNFLWGKSWKSSATYDAAYSITTDISDNIILTGVSFNYLQNTYINKILIVKFDSQGKLLWSKNWGSSGLDEAEGPRSVKTDSSGNIYVGGNTQYGNGDMDALLLKLDVNGNLIWAKNWGGKYYDSINGIDLDGKGNIYAVGETKSFSGNQSSLFLIQFDSFGNLTSSKIWNNSYESTGNMILFYNNDLIIGGQAYNADGDLVSITGAEGSLFDSTITPSSSVNLLTDISKNIQGVETAETGTIDDGGGNSDILLLNLNILTNSPFLVFPLKYFTPYNVPMISVFDHSGHRLCPNDTVEDFTGEIAVKKDLYEPPARSDCGYLYSFKKIDGSKFLSRNANYVGTRSTGPTTLNYDGNPGYDFAVDTGTAVYSSASGTVVISHKIDNSKEGKYIQIIHEDGYITEYEHLNEINVKVGQVVRKGDLIGYSGITGGVTPSFYFEVKKIIGTDTISIDPYGWLGNGKDPYSKYYKVSNYNIWSAISPTNYTTIMDEFNDSTLGIATGITYAPAVSGEGAVFKRENKSRISYPFNYGIPTEGTLEWWVNIQSGYWYNNYTLFDNQTSAQLFGSDSYEGDVNWPGAMRLIVSSNGRIQLITGNSYDTADYNILTASSSFTFGQWHSIGISYGSSGQYIIVDGSLVASDSTYTQRLGSAGNLSAPVDTPTIGQCISGFWNSNQNDGGFNGIVDRFRASSKQKDWSLARTIVTNISETHAVVPNSFVLFQNYPNPFNPSTKISYSVPITSFVTIKVYNILGKEITTLVNDVKYSGKYSTEFNAGNLSSGVYFYRMQAIPVSGIENNHFESSGKIFTDTKKFILLK